MHPEIETKYPGEYIAIIGKNVVSHGKDFKKVFREAEKHGKEAFIHKVPYKDKDLIVWLNSHLLKDIQIDLGKS